CGSSTATGTATSRNFEPTSAEGHDSETTTNPLPFASAVTALTASFTETVSPTPSSLVFVATSPADSVVDPTSNNTDEFKEKGDKLADHLTAASNKAQPLLLRAVALACTKNTPARRAGALIPTMVVPVS